MVSPKAISPPSPPQPIPPPVVPPPVTLQPGDRVYVSVQDDMWDLIAIRVYGKVRGNEHLMYRLLEANYHLVDIGVFSAGIPVIVPEIQITTEIPLVPWKSTTVLPATPAPPLP